MATAHKAAGSKAELLESRRSASGSCSEWHPQELWGGQKTCCFLWDIGWSDLLGQVSSYLPDIGEIPSSRLQRLDKITLVFLSSPLVL